MFKVPKLTILAREAIRELEASGVRVTPEEVLLLNRLGELSMAPDDFQLLTFCYKSYGNLKVYPLTLGAKLWLQRFESDYPNDKALQSQAILYAFNNSRNPDMLDFKDDKECRKKLYDFNKKINLTEDEALKLVDLVTSESVEGKKSITPEGFELDKDNSLIPALSLLMNTYGKDTQYWLWQESEEVVQNYLIEAIKLSSDKKISINDRSLLAFAEIKRMVAIIKKERSPSVLVEDKDKVI